MLCVGRTLLRMSLAMDVRLVLYNVRTTELKLLQTNAAVWFKKMCKIKQLKPNYINIKINWQNSQD